MQILNSINVGYKNRFNVTKPSCTTAKYEQKKKSVFPPQFDQFKNMKPTKMVH